MPTPPKLSPEQWGGVRRAWENDSRPAFTWIVKTMGLPVSPNAVRKRAEKERWSKVAQEPAEKLSATAIADLPKVSAGTIEEPSANSRNHPGTVSAHGLKLHRVRETPLLLELDKEQPQQGLFVREYLKDLNGTQAAIRAGYSAASADVSASRLLATDRIRAAIRELRDELLSRIEADAEAVLRTLVDQLNADINELSQHRRVCCRACHGEGNAYQCTPLEYGRAKLKHDEKRAKLLKDSEGAVDIGEFPSVEGDWYDKRKAPNPECPECFGDGIGEVILGDTRYLSKAAKALYGGVKQGREGIEILINSREKVINQLARVLGMFKDKDPANNGVSKTPEELGMMFWGIMEKARARQQQVYAERGIVIENGDPE